MSRSMPVDNTNIYRYKRTVAGVRERDGWGHKAGEAYEEVYVQGPYATKVALTQWRAPRTTLKVELQRLDVNPVTLELEWYTLKETILKDSDD